MTTEQLQEILRELQLETHATAGLIHVFYQTDDGRVNNFSISVHCAHDRRGRAMSAADLTALMQREYPDTRQARLLAVEHPRKGLGEWLDTHDVCQRLRVCPRTLRRWTLRGHLHPARLGRRVYYDAAEVDALLRSNIIQDNGRLDKVG